MTLHQFILKWNNTWRYDYWWRQKYKVAFNSEIHKNANQIDIAFEYFEHRMSEKAVQSYKDNEEKSKLFKDGIVIRESEVDRQKEEALLDKIDFTKF